MIEQLKSVLKMFGNLFMWLAPFALFLVAIILPVYLLKLDFNQFLEFIQILVWPVTVVIILFFFKKVATYLFFSMEEFNFFGAKGTLKNINEVIIAEVNKKFLEEKSEENRKVVMKKLNSEIDIKENEIKKAKGTAEENLKLAKEVMSEWKKSTEQSNKIINDLATENKRLNEVLSGLPSNDASKFETNFPPVIDDSKTSDPILEAGNTDK